LYTKEYADGTTTDLTLYVDDAFVTTDAENKALADLHKLDERFGGTLKENPEYFLGLNIHYGGVGHVRLSCATYIGTLRKRFPVDQMVASRRDVEVPCDKELTDIYEKAVSAIFDQNAHAELLRRYGTKVGSLIYLVPTARCDVAATIGLLARCLTFPTVEMENAADRCLRYLYNTATLGIAFDGSQGATMVAHSDSDWALRHSTTGYLLHHGSLVGPPIGYVGANVSTVSRSHRVKQRLWQHLKQLPR